VSVLLRPPVAPLEAGLLPLVVAVGAAEALDEDARIVWPNDILVGGRKVAGILCEMSADQERVAWAVAGIGVNVRSAPDLDDARWRPGALGDGGDPPRRGDLLVTLLASIGRRYAQWIGGDAAGVLAGYAARDALRGRDIVVSLPRGELSGRCEGTDDLGRLRVVTGEGERLLGAGEVVRISGY
jgi:BirA family transcriptional regulator, biotin operon repressor / biotin---[acetyl-CoA-carboxylase] ligase